MNTSTLEFRRAVSEGRLAEAEEYLMDEQKNPSQSGHDGLWLQNNLAILAHAYLSIGNKEALERINDQLPVRYQIRPRE